MIEHCLKPNPNAEKWNEVKLSLFKVKPEVEDWDTSYVGRAWGVAKAHFKPLKPQGKPLEDSEAPPLKPLEVTEVVPEGLTGGTLSDFEASARAYPTRKSSSSQLLHG
jgi:hypothetical protein